MSFSPYEVRLPASAGFFARHVAGLFAQLVTEPFPRRLYRVHAALAPLVAVVYRGNPPELRSPVTEAPPPPPPPAEAEPDAPPAVLVAFSGGKDSLAAALHLRHTGRRVTLLHVAGIGPAPREAQSAATAAAAAVGLPLVQYPVSTVGHTDLPCNPVQNVLIAAICADHATAHRIPAFALGDTRADTLDAVNLRANLSDAQEVLEAARPFFALSPFGQKLPPLLPAEACSFATIARLAPRAFAFVQSCDAPPRFRDKWRAGNAARFQLAMLRGRCGSCHKCAHEWLMLALCGALPWDDAFARHALSTLRRKGSRATPTPDRELTLDEVLRRFFPAPHVPEEWRRRLSHLSPP